LNEYKLVDANGLPRYPQGQTCYQEYGCHLYKRKKKLTSQNPGYTCDLTSYQTCKWVKRFPTP